MTRTAKRVLGALGGVLLGGAVLQVAGCDTGAPVVQRPHKQPPKAQLGPGERILLLPDSAIVVAKGSTEEALADYLASKDPAPRTFRFTSPEFEPWADKPNPRTLATMYAMVQILRAYPQTQVTLAGFTDDQGSLEDNRRLAQARVDRLAAMLERGGVPRGRVTREAHPKEAYLADNATEKGRSANRRIELTVTAK